MSKKLISMLLALAMAVSLAACAKTGSTSSDEGHDGPTRQSIGIPLSPNCTDIENNWLTGYLEEKLNVELEFVTFSSNNTERAQQLGTMVAAGEELPDILLNWVNLDRTLVHTYGNDGYFVDLAPYFDDPEWELAKEFHWHEDAIDRLGEDNHKRMLYNNRTADGALYGWPSGSVAQSDTIMNHVYINQAWLDTLGLEMPTTWDEMLTVLRAFRDQDPNGNGKKDEIPMLGGANVSAVYAADIPSWLLNNFAFVSDNYFFNVDENGKLYVPYNTDEYREGLRALHQLVDEGLLSELTWTIGDRTEMPGLWTPVSGEAIVGIISGYVPQHTTEGSPLVLDYVPLAPLEGSYTPVRPATAANNTFITTDCEDVEGAMRFLFSLNEVDIYRVTRFGEEGVDWEPVVDESGVERVNVINDVFNKPNNKTWSVQVPCVSFPWERNVYGMYSAPVVFEELSREEQIDHWRNKLKDLMYDANIPNTANNPSPLFFNAVYTTEEAEENGTLVADIKTFMKQQRGMFATGALDINDDAVWQSYVEALDKQGLPTILKNAQAAWERQQ